MTSSTPPTNSNTNQHNQQPARQSPTFPTKLTNFSIDALIREPTFLTDNVRQEQSNPMVQGNRMDHQRKQPQAPLLCSPSNFSCSTSSNPQSHRQHQPQQHRSTTSSRKVRPKNFLCPACEMAFSNNGQLRNHARIHTGERPFRCQYEDCNKTFTRNEELTRHKLIHSGFRPHACSTCNKRFGRKDHLKKHLKTHENKRNRQLRKQITTTFTISSQTQLLGNQIRPTSDHASGGQCQDHPAFMVTLSNTPGHVDGLSPPPVKQSQNFTNNSPPIIDPVPLSTFMNVAPTNAGLNLPPLSSVVETNTVSTPISSFMQQAAYLSARMTTTNQVPQPSSSIQQLADEYWRWYNLMGLYQIDGPYNQTVHQMDPTRYQDQ